MVLTATLNDLHVLNNNPVLSFWSLCVIPNKNSKPCVSLVCGQMLVSPDVQKPVPCGSAGSSEDWDH